MQTMGLVIIQDLLPIFLSDLKTDCFATCFTRGFCYNTQCVKTRQNGKIVENLNFSKITLLRFLHSKSKQRKISQNGLIFSVFRTLCYTLMRRWSFMRLFTRFSPNL